MKAKINSRLICIPPYISAQWNQISLIESLKDEAAQETILRLHLEDRSVVNIPNLDPKLIEIIFEEHARYLETSHSMQEEVQKIEDKLSPLFSMIQHLSKGTDIQILASKSLGSTFVLPGIQSGHGSLEIALQHSPEHKDHPDLPAEILEKITETIQQIAESHAIAMPIPEPHCNCMHCQIGRALQSEEDEEVSDEDLQFHSWDVVQCGDQTYAVTNPIDPTEQFNVYLGTPLGCTCGKTNCEHIEAVLLT